MKIIVGSKNQTKIKAVERNFPDEEVFSLDVPSKVSVQPFSDEETLKGAIQRAKQCAKQGAYGIGLEGGVMYARNQLYLCNWGALVTPDSHVFTASGARIPLPRMVETQLKAGFELGDVMDEFAGPGVRHQEGAIGVFTANLVTREELFAHIVKLLRGEWEYHQVTNDFSRSVTGRAAPLSRLDET